MSPTNDALAPIHPRHVGVSTVPDHECVLAIVQFQVELLSLTGV